MPLPDGAVVQAATRSARCRRGTRRKETLDKKNGGDKVELSPPVEVANPVAQKLSLAANSMLRGSAELVGWPKVDGIEHAELPGVGPSDEG